MRLIGGLFLGGFIRTRFLFCGFFRLNRRLRFFRRRGYLKLLRCRLLHGSLFLLFFRFCGRRRWDIGSKLRFVAAADMNGQILCRSQNLAQSLLSFLLLSRFTIRGFLVQKRLLGRFYLAEQLADRILRLSETIQHRLHILLQSACCFQ